MVRILSCLAAVFVFVAAAVHDGQPSRLQEIMIRGAGHPEKPFDFAEKAYWVQRDVALKAFVDHWVQTAIKDGSFARIYANWFE